jgi:hypothetical protein
MKESDWRYLVDTFLFICLGGMALIGVLLGFVIPAGPTSSESAKYFLGLHRHQWGNIHAYLSIAFVVLTIVHLVLNWKWITVRTSQIFRRRAAPILISAVSVPFLVLIVFWAFTPKDAAKYREYGIEMPERGQLQRTVPKDKVPVAGEAAGRQEYPAEDISQVEPGRREDTPGEEDHRAVGSLVISGRQTLYDIERVTGLSARSIADRLGLPSSASLNETLGRLRRLYGFEIQEVREVVDRMLKE